MFCDTVLYRHDRRGRNQREHEPDTREPEVVRQSDQLRQVAEALRLKHALWPRVGLHRPAAEMFVDLVRFRNWIDPVGDQHFDLRDRADEIESLPTLQEVEMTVNVVLFGGIIAGED